MANITISLIKKNFSSCLFKQTDSLLHFIIFERKIWKFQKKSFIQNSITPATLTDASLTSFRFQKVNG